jgi:hypothetical protein
MPDLRPQEDACGPKQKTPLEVLKYLLSEYEDSDSHHIHSLPKADLELIRQTINNEEGK